MVARQAHNLEVVGSSPSSATIVREITGLDGPENVNFVIFQPEEEYWNYSSSFFMLKNQLFLF